MRRTLIQIPSFARRVLSHSIHDGRNFNISVNLKTVCLSKPRFLSSEDSSGSSEAETHEGALQESLGTEFPVKDVSNKEFKGQIKKYLYDHEEEALKSIMESILLRRISGKHEETDDEIMEELRLQPLSDVKDREFESDFEDLYKTDDEIPNLYSTMDYVKRRMLKDEFFNIDEHKYDEMIKEAMDHGYLKDTRECEHILEDMLHWDNLLPEKIKEKVKAKVNELGDMCERGELEPEEACKIFLDFEDEIVPECIELMKSEQPPDTSSTPSTKKSGKAESDDPPGEGPILRWETRVVFAPGGDAWHPKNRKVKLAVTVKELGLSKPAFCRLRELVGKRYHPGRDELTITSERYDHREENRKDCLRTLYALIDEAQKANDLAEEARTLYLKEKLRENPEFMSRLRAKTARMRTTLPI